MTRKNNTEYHAGHKAFRDNQSVNSCPYLNTEDTRRDPDSRFNRWCLGFSEAAADAEESVLSARYGF